MKRVFSGLLGLSFVGFALFAVFIHTVPAQKKLVLGISPTSSPIISSTETPTVSAQNTTKTLFVPYWTVGNTKIEGDYQKIAYFGISVNKNGIDREDVGYKKIDTFLKNSNASEERLLTVRMINSDVNATVLSNQKLQQDIATESAAVAKQKGFDGVLLDFEIAAISFDSVIKGINDFTKMFSTQVKSKNLSFYATTYGDTFYRLRPFDISTLDKDVDGFFVMAYDFHKANGDTPGPNFPLSGKDIYGYDFQTMASDFLKYTKPEKLSIIFGMYGYDWQLTDNKQSVGTAVSLTSLQALQKFFPCNLQDCSVRQDATSSETEVTYKDTHNIMHDVWYENLDSVKKKTEFLKSKGINSVGYWAYSYF